jgi:catechol 2,3-dioxygenase-like lactoylglutathione lyase family enzyme
MANFTEAGPTLPAADIDRARAFYEQTLGLEVEEVNPGGVMYKVGSSHLFVYPSEFAGTNKATAANLEVDDIRAAVADLRGKGITFEQYDFPGLKTDEDGIADLGGELAAWFVDPEGNIVAVGQRHTA